MLSRGNKNIGQTTTYANTCHTKKVKEKKPLCFVLLTAQGTRTTVLCKYCKT